MKIVLSDYKVNRETILRIYKESGIYKTLELSVCSHIPLIAVYCFLNEEHGGFEDKIQELTDFYKYTEIIK